MSYKKISVVTGTDKARFPGAAAFAVSSSIEARIKIESNPISGSDATIFTSQIINNDGTTATTWGAYGIVPVNGPLQVSMSSGAGAVIVFER